MKGEQVTPRYLERHGFNYPIMVTEMEGLGLKLPPQTFSVKDVEQYVGKDCFQTTADDHSQQQQPRQAKDSLLLLMISLQSSH